MNIKAKGSTESFIINKTISHFIKSLDDLVSLPNVDEGVDALREYPTPDSEAVQEGCPFLQFCKDKQDEAYSEGRSRLKFPNSKHNKKPSDAADVGPYDASRKKVPWPDEATIKAVAAGLHHELFKALEIYIKDQCLWYMFIGYVLGTAEQMGIDIRSGADWDMDTQVTDQTFNDLGHFEIYE